MDFKLSCLAPFLPLYFFIVLAHALPCMAFVDSAGLRRQRLRARRPWLAAKQEERERAERRNKTSSSALRAAAAAAADMPCYAVAAEERESPVPGHIRTIKTLLPTKQRDSTRCNRAQIE